MFDNLVDATKYAFETHYMPIIKDNNNHNWRIERYYNEYVDNAIKAYLPILDAIYKSYAPKKDPSRKE